MIGIWVVEEKVSEINKESENCKKKSHQLNQRFKHDTWNMCPQGVLYRTSDGNRISEQIGQFTIIFIFLSTEKINFCIKLRIITTLLLMS